MKTLIFWLLCVTVAYGQRSSGFTLNTGLPPGKLYLDSSRSGIVYIDTLGTGGSGTVTNFSFTNVHGLSGIVTNPTTTPNLTLTPDSASFWSLLGLGVVSRLNTVVTSVNASGTNGITVSGVPITSTGTIALGITNKSIADSSIHDTTITYNKLQHNSLVDYLLGATTAYHDVQPIKLGANLSMSNDTLKATNSGGTVTTFSATGNNGISTSVSNPTTTPALTIGITNGSIGDSSLHSTFLKTAVTSVAATATNGLAVSGSPITTTGTLAFSINNLSLADSSLHDTTITYGKLQHNSLANYLLGATTAYHDVQPIKLGTNLAMSNDTLKVSGTFSGTTSTTIIDMSSPASQIIKDTVVSSQPLIHVTTKPSIPQFYYVVRAADIPTNTVATSYMAVLTLGGKNRNTAASVTVNWVACRGTNPATEFAGASSAAPAAVNFWEMAGFFNTKGVSVGDTLGIKLWSSVGDTTDFRYASIYFIPRLISPPDGQFYFYGQSNNSTSNVWDYQTTLFGANAGVSQVQISNQPTMFVLDSATASAVLQPIMTNALPQVIFMIGSGQYMGFGVSSIFSDVDNFSSTNAVSILASLPASNGTARRIRYIRKWTIGAH